MADTFSSLPISRFVRDWVFVTLFRVFIWKGGLSLEWVHLACCFKIHRFARAGCPKYNAQINILRFYSRTYMPVILSCDPDSCCIICCSVLVFEHVTTIFLTPKSPGRFLCIKTKFLYEWKQKFFTSVVLERTVFDKFIEESSWEFWSMFCLCCSSLVGKIWAKVGFGICTCI
jgi:hypothetical protein